MVTWNIPSEASVGQAGHTSDHNLITSALDEIVELLPSYYNAVYYGADPTGADDSTAAFQSIATAMGTSPATVFVPPGTYKTSHLPSLVQNQNFIGDGSASTNINYTGSTTALTVNINGTFTGAENAGKIAGFTLSGYDATGTPNAIQYGDLQGIVINDVQIYGFDGVGLYGVNASGDWAEEGNIQMTITQCGTAAVFNGGSYDYTNFDFLIVTGPGQGGITLENDCQMQGVSLRMRGNFYSSSPNTAAVIAIEPSNTSGTSYIYNSFIDCAVETAGSTGTGHYTLYMGSSNSESQLANCTGILSFSNVTVDFQGLYNPNNNPFGFSGVIHDTVIGEMIQGDALAVAGGIDYAIENDSTANLYESTLYLQFGDIQVFVLDSGVNHLVFQGLSGFGKDIVIIAKQPSGGGATIVWPSNVHFPTSPVVTVSTTASTATMYKMIYIPQDNVFYAQILGTGYTT